MLAHCVVLVVALLAAASALSIERRALPVLVARPDNGNSLNASQLAFYLKWDHTVDENLDLVILSPNGCLVYAEAPRDVDDDGGSFAPCHYSNGGIGEYGGTYSRVYRGTTYTQTWIDQDAVDDTSDQPGVELLTLTNPPTGTYKVMAYSETTSMNFAVSNIDARLYVFNTSSTTNYIAQFVNGWPNCRGRFWNIASFTVNTVNPISVSFTTTDTVTATPLATFGTTNGQPFEGDPEDRPDTGC